MDGYHYEDTICALATPPGVGAVAIVRCSGPRARTVAEKLLRDRKGRPLTLEPRRVFTGLLVDPEDERPIDEVVVFLMAAPRSFTREDVVEIQCHGNPLVARRILGLLARLGVRLAHPGEFTRRAFLNGRLGLSEAEAINDLIQAPTEAAAEVALDQLHGALRRQIQELRSALIDMTALIEANMDFPEEDIEILDRQALRKEVAQLGEQVAQLAATHRRGRLLKGGIRTLLAGRPNAGKSSLMNLLLKEERAIVTEIPGTTRDTLEEGFAHRGVAYSLVDSAGLRDTTDTVEALGVERARVMMREVDLVIYLVDASAPGDVDELDLLNAQDPARFQLVLNKVDLPRRLELGFEESFSNMRPVAVCARDGGGIEALLDRLHRRAQQQIVPASRGTVITSERHRQCLESAAASLDQFHTSVGADVPLDVALVDLYDATQSLGHVVGEVVTDDILDRIFEKFCIGK